MRPLKPCWRRWPLLLPSLLMAWHGAATTPCLASQTVYVDDDNCPGPGTGTQADPYCKIQDAICAIKDAGGGTVLVRPGTYNESLRMFGGISVVSTDGPSVTTIDATGKPCITSACVANPADPTCSVVVYGSGPTSADRLEGFRITGGAGILRENGGPVPNFIVGGGIFIFNSSPTITRNEIVGNTLQRAGEEVFYGAGIYVEGANGTPSPPRPAITLNLIEGNVADPPDGRRPADPTSGIGGAIYAGRNSAPVIEENTIRNNRAGDPNKLAQIGGGGGIALYGFLDEAVVSRNLFQDNSAADFGGGLSLGEFFDGLAWQPSLALIENNIVEYNEAQDGGGAVTATTRARFLNNTFTDNRSVGGGHGGGLFLSETGNPGDQATLVSNLVVFNSALDDGRGGGLAVNLSDPVVRFNDLYGNVPTNVDGDKTDPDYIGVDGNLSVDPLFVNRGPAGRDLHLQEASPAIEAGEDPSTGSSSEDFDGAPRIQDADYDGSSRIDQGAYEFSPDRDGDQDPDWTDPDDDGDGVLDAADCAPLSRGVSSSPGPTGPTLRVDRSGTSAVLRWLRGEQGHTSNVYRGTITQPWSYNETCLLEESPGPSHTDAEVPGTGQGFYYLVSARNVCGESPMGQDGQGNDLFPSASCPPQGADSDVDGIRDVEDNCPLGANLDQSDSDGDWVGDLCDVCAGLPNPDQADADGDGSGNPCDCAPSDPSTASPPGEVLGLRVDRGASTTLTWTDQGAGVAYDVAGGLLSVLLSEEGATSAGCLADDQTPATWNDTRPDPSSGDGHYYLVRGQNDCDGSYGQDSSGAERQLPNACP